MKGIRLIKDREVVRTGRVDEIGLLEKTCMAWLAASASISAKTTK